jgi:hypothetical protein
MRIVNNVCAVEVGEIVTVKPSEFGNDTYQGPMEVLEVSKDRTSLLLAAGPREVWFHSQRIEGSKELLFAEVD